VKVPEIIKKDPWLEPYSSQIKSRIRHFSTLKTSLYKNAGFSFAHRYYGEHYEDGMTVIREWAPNAESIRLLCDSSGWQPDDRFSFSRLNHYGDWEIKVPLDVLSHGSHYRLYISWPGGSGDRIPAYARRVVQDPVTYIFTAQVWQPPEQYSWQIESYIPKNLPPVIYEAHIGMAREHGGIGTFSEFRENILPRIAAGGFNTIQLMALMEHPYYASFGYQVSSFFALSSRYGTPEEFKQLVDECHKNGIRVIMDLVHSHAVKNEVEGIGFQDGSNFLYFHGNHKGTHPAWDSRCFDYGKHEVRNFLLSNCRFWIEEYRLDGFRFDGVTSMLYNDHGLGAAFDHYDKYFGSNVDEDAFLYLSLANDLVHGINTDALTIAEDMSGMPGMGKPPEDGGCGFDYRLTMGLPDYWIKIIKDRKDEDWRVSEFWEVLSNRRYGEKHIAYSESHDQALVGDKTILFRLMDSAMYTDMSVDCESLSADRGIAYYKLINLLTFSAGGDGYMCFMGNEFGHPEWIDFPREGNNWSYHYARRQWSLSDNPGLRYYRLNKFTADMIHKCSSSLNDSSAELKHCNNHDGVLAYIRGGLIYVININQSVSFTHYGICVKKGRWGLVFNTDSVDYDGQGRVPEQLELDTVTDGDGKTRLRLYLPARTGLVFKRID